MEFEYKQKVTALFDELVQINEDSLKMAIDLFAEAIVEDHMIHTFGTGHSHMIGLELFVRAGGLANVNAILDSRFCSFFNGDFQGFCGYQIHQKTSRKG